MRPFVRTCLSCKNIAIGLAVTITLVAILISATENTPIPERMHLILIGNVGLLPLMMFFVVAIGILSATQSVSQFILELSIPKLL